MKQQTESPTEIKIDLVQLLVRHKWHIIFGAVYFLLSLYVMLAFLNNSRLGDAFSRTNFNATIEGKSWKPFAYRVFIPRLTVMVDDLTPTRMKRSTEKKFKSFLKESRYVKRYMPWLEGLYATNTYKRLVASILIYMCLWGYIIAMYFLARQLFAQQQAMWYFAPALGLFAVTSFSWQWLFLYDIPVLFLSAACYACIAARNYALYFIFFTLACLNKESAVYILLFYTLVSLNRRPYPEVAKLLAIQVAIYVLIRFLIYQAFQGNVGFFLEDNTARILNEDWFRKSKYFQLVSISVMFFMLTYGWNSKPEFLKKSLWLLPVCYLAYFLYGFPGEYRVFLDIMPLMLMLVTHTLVVGTGIAQSPVFAAAPAIAEGEPS